MSGILDSSLPKAAWGVGIAYLLLGGLMTANILSRGESPYLLPALWGGTGIFLSPFSAIVLLLGRSSPLSRTATIMAQLPLLGFGLTAALAFVAVGIVGIHPD